jgi:hypothetical protein
MERLKAETRREILTVEVWFPDVRVVEARCDTWAAIDEVMSHDATTAPDSCVPQQHQPANNMESALCALD